MAFIILGKDLVQFVASTFCGPCFPSVATVACYVLLQILSLIYCLGKHLIVEDGCSVDLSELDILCMVA